MQNRFIKQYITYWVRCSLLIPPDKWKHHMRWISKPWTFIVGVNYVAVIHMHNYFHTKTRYIPISHKKHQLPEKRKMLLCIRRTTNINQQWWVQISVSFLRWSNACLVPTIMAWQNVRWLRRDTFLYHTRLRRDHHMRVPSQNSPTLLFIFSVTIPVHRTVFRSHMHGRRHNLSPKTITCKDSPWK